MKKIIWFTKEQVAQLEEIKSMSGKNNSEVVRAGMKLLLEHLKNKQGV